MRAKASREQARTSADDAIPDLLAAANDAARREVSQQWFFFITLTLLLAVSVGTTTHRALLDAAPMRLPVLNVELPLLGFYALAPTIFVVLHFYALFQVRALRGKVAAFMRAAEARAAAEAPPGTDAHAAALERLVRPLDGFAVVQAFAAPRLRRRAPAAQVMTAITLVIAPVLLLVFFLVRFLPYQDEATTHLHRALVAIDMAMIWLMLPPSGAIARGVAALSAAAVMGFCLTVATIRGEPLDKPWPVAAALRAALFFDGELDKQNRPLPKPFSRVLILPDQKLIRVSEAEVADERIARTIVLRERNLRGAILIASDLRKADLGGADLRGARLDGAWLTEASLAGATLQGAMLDNATLRDANLEKAELTGASLKSALLEAASFTEARLMGAALDGVRAQGASFKGAWLHGASLEGALLEGASLVEARVQGASLVGAHLRAADLRGASAWRANGWRARLDLVDARGLRLSGFPDGWEPASTGEDAYPWDRDVDDWRDTIPAGAMRDAAIERLSMLTKHGEGADRLDALHAAFAALERSNAMPVEGRLTVIACAPEGAPYVARGILRQIWDSGQRDIPSEARVAIAYEMLDPVACPGTAGLTATERAHLRAIRDGLD